MHSSRSAAINQAGPHGTLTSVYDEAGRRLAMWWPDSFGFIYDWLNTGEMQGAREGPYTGSGVAGWGGVEG